MTFVLSGTYEGQHTEWPLKDGRYTVGRGSQNDINLSSRSVSRRHAEVIVQADGLRVRDLDSSNGTWINGRQVQGEAPVNPHDRLRFGNLEFVVIPPTGTPQRRIPTETIFAEPDEISTMERLSWEEARGPLVDDAPVDRNLFRTVTEASQLLMAPRSLEETYDIVLDLVERVIPARRILLLLPEESGGEPRVRAARPVTAGDERLALSSTIIGTVLADRQALLLIDTMADPRFAAQESIVQQNLRSAMVAPLFDNKDVLGLLYLDSDNPRIHYDRNQLRALTLLANLIAVKITNTRLMEAQREKERMEQELAVAAQVQKRLLPSELPAIQGYQAHAYQDPCLEVGGDLYDVTQLADGRVAIAVGDVSGKGMGAALLMSNTIASLRVLFEEDLDAASMVERLHRQILRSSDITHFVTLFVALLDPQTHRLEYVNGGHNAPLLLLPDGTHATLEATGMPVGMLPGATYEAQTIEFAPGSLLCVFSDGYPEAQMEEEFYGDERFFDSVKRHRHESLDAIVTGIQTDLDTFLCGCPLGDDTTLLLLRREDPACEH